VPSHFPDGWPLYRDPSLTSRSAGVSRFRHFAHRPERGPRPGSANDGVCACGKTSGRLDLVWVCWILSGPKLSNLFIRSRIFPIYFSPSTPANEINFLGWFPRAVVRPLPRLFQPRRRRFPFQQAVPERRRAHRPAARSLTCGCAFGSRPAAVRSIGCGSSSAPAPSWSSRCAIKLRLRRRRRLLHSVAEESQVY
jgi:hypothetical protein